MNLTNQTDDDLDLRLPELNVATPMFGSADDDEEVFSFYYGIFR